jgi:hypothetical protein
MATPNSSDDLERIESLVSQSGWATQLLDRLPADQRDAVYARIIDERSYAEIAQELQTSELVVRKRVSRGLSAQTTQPCSGRVPLRAVAPARRERLGEHLAGQVDRELCIAGAPQHVADHRGLVANVQRHERIRLRPAGGEQRGICGIGPTHVRHIEQQ